ncbi:MAG TPA: heme-binding protein [Casimicrobiaceae bacterium]|nr:heme-binding protein [Casimicrobiaceae bacterium]
MAHPGPVRCALALAAFALAELASAQAPKLTLPVATLQTGAALTAAQAAFARCQKDGYTVAVAVVDRGGHALALLRDPLAGAHTIQTATGKAWTAVSFRTDTTELAGSTQAGRPSSGIRSLPGVVAVGGGMMIRAKGVMLGGIGVSGAPGGDQDDVCAKAGLAAIVDAIELE